MSGLCCSVGSAVNRTLCGFSLFSLLILSVRAARHLPALILVFAVVSFWSVRDTWGVEPSKIEFQHHDWELVCDNTLTCRIAGYHGSSSPLAGSILFVRKAGSNAAIMGKAKLGNYDNDSYTKALPARFTFTLYVNNRELGSVVFSKSNMEADLSPDQVNAILLALRRVSVIDLKRGRLSIRISDIGAAAVMLKMDEFQGRIDTPSALVRKGTRSNASVHPPLPLPVVYAPSFVPAKPNDQNIFKDKKARESLRKELRKTVRKIDDIDGIDWCENIDDPQSFDKTLDWTRITQHKLLVSSSCRDGAYSFPFGYWVINEKQPYAPQLVTTFGSDDEGVHVFANHKGRGPGDCWSSERWTWNGQEFVATEAYQTGMCRGVRYGGTWVLPTLVSKVVYGEK